MNVCGSMSTSTGVAPASSIAATVATAVWLTVKTASPGPMPAARSASTSASVPLATPIACGGADELRELALERRDRGPEDVAPALQGLAHRRLDLVAVGEKAGVRIGWSDGLARHGASTSEVVREMLAVERQRALPGPRAAARAAPSRARARIRLASA